MTIDFLIVVDHRRPIAREEPQLTDDEDTNGRDASPPEQDVPEIEQQKKRRRTANYQHVTSTATTNGNHEDDRTSPPSGTCLSIASYSTIMFARVVASTNNVGSLSSRHITDNGSYTTSATPVLLQSSTEHNHNEGNHRATLSKQRFNIPSMSRGLTPTYDLSQSPLFSVGARVSSLRFACTRERQELLFVRKQSKPPRHRVEPLPISNPLCVHDRLRRSHRSSSSLSLLGE